MKASSSAGEGGMPVRSSAARRRRVGLSAAADGEVCRLDDLVAVARRQRAELGVEGVEAHVRLAGGGVGAVTLVAVVRQNGFDVAGEVDLPRRIRSGRGRGGRK